MLCFEDQFKQGVIKDVIDVNCNIRVINFFFVEYIQFLCFVFIVFCVRSLVENLESEYQFLYIC